MNHRTFQPHWSGLSSAFLILASTLIPAVSASASNRPEIGNFTQTIRSNTSMGVAEVTFVGSSAAKFVIIHYQVNGQAQQNITMNASSDSITWTENIGSLKLKDSILYSFTYWIGSSAVDSPQFSYAFGNPTPSPSPIPSAAPSPTPSPTTSPSPHPSPTMGPSGANSGKYVNLVWNDEFNATGSVDYKKWNIEINCDGGGNNEWECYGNSTQNIYQDGKGNLVLQVIQNSYNAGGYTSGRINTSGKGDWTNGRVESRIKVPSGQGFWPAFWMMPTANEYGGWPTSGELDIMEILGGAPTVQYGTAHYGEYSPYTQAGGTFTSPDFSQAYHIFAIERDTHQIRWYMDNSLYFTLNDTDHDFWNNTAYAGSTPPDGEKWPFNQEFHVILNAAMGGSWPGNPDPSIKSGQMLIDYVRVFQ